MRRTHVRSLAPLHPRVQLQHLDVARGALRREVGEPVLGLYPDFSKFVKKML